MLYLLGNCQMDFLQRSLAARGTPCAHRALASPLTLLSAHGAVPPLLQEMSARFGLEEHMHERRLAQQFSFLEEQAAPAAIAINLFHENEPLFSHKEERYVFFLDPQCWEELPGVARWMKKQFEILQPNPYSYLQRFGRMLERLRARFPETPLLLLSRLRAYPAFGPQPSSYLKEWPAFQDQAAEAYAAWSQRFGCAVLDTDRVFAGIWAEQERSIGAHCPFLRVRVEEQEGVALRLELERDIEHVGSLWPRLAEKIDAFLSTGVIEYTAQEIPPAEWLRPAKPEKLDDASLERLLAGGSNYGWARAVGAMLCDPGRDYSDLLAVYGQVAPVCHNLLHMIDNYCRIHKNPVMAVWCASHRPKVLAFEQNGVHYRRNYLERVGRIEQRVARNETP